MTYTILAVRQIDDTLYTDVLYDLDGVEAKVSIPHFQPQSKADVELGIVNRAASEVRKATSAETLKIVAAELEIGKPVEIP